MTEAVSSIVVADDHPIVLRGFSAMIDADPAFRVVGTAADGRAALDLVVSAAPDIAVLDLNMPGLSGLEVLRRLKHDARHVRVVMLAASATDAEIYDITAAGAAGLVFKEAAVDSLVDCLRTVARGGRWLPADRTGPATQRETARREKWRELSRRLTVREAEIVTLVLAGESNKGLAFRLEVSEGTAKVHLNNIFRKLHVGSRAELVALAKGQDDFSDA